MPPCGPFQPPVINSDAELQALASALSKCSGGEVNVVVSGALVLQAPIVVGADTKVSMIGKGPASISGGGTGRVFEVSRGSTLTMQGIDLTDGTAGEGVAAKGAAATAAADASADGEGGIIFADAGSTLLLTRATLSNGRAAARGGAIASRGRIELAACTLTNNTAAHGGGAVAMRGGALLSEDTDFTNNHCDDPEASSDMSPYSIGCFVEPSAGDGASSASMSTSQQPRILPHGPASRGHGSDKYNTPAECNRHCQGFRYLGVEHRTRCYCGNRLHGGADAARPARRALCRQAGWSACPVQPSGSGGGAGAGAQRPVYCGGSGYIEIFEVQQYPAGGGALAATDGALVTVAGGTWRRNSAFSGGAVALAGAALSIARGAVFSHNVARLLGGAVAAAANSTLRAAGASFADNHCERGPDGDLIHGGWGGAIASTDAAGETVIVDCVFKGNKAYYGGAVAAAAGAPLRLARSDFNANKATGDGGALFISDSSAALDSVARLQEASVAACSFNNSTAVSPAATGGAVYVEGISILDMTDSVLVGNAAARRGGALMLYRGVRAALRNVTLRANTLLNSTAEQQWNRYGAALAVDGGYQRYSAPVATTALVADSYITDNGCWNCAGGGLHALESASVLLLDTVVARNSASQAGGIQVRYSSTLNMTRGALSDNYASSTGGGLTTYINATVTLDSVVIENNRAGALGGFVSMKGSPEVTNGLVMAAGGTSLVFAEHCNISRNRAAQLGGAAYVFGDNLRLHNCTVEGNVAERGSGGAVYVGANSTCVITESRVLANKAQQDGGAFCFDGTLYSNTGDLQTYSYFDKPFYPIIANISDTVIANNIASVRGGGVYGTNYVTLRMDGVRSSANMALTQAPALYLSANSNATLSRCVFDAERVSAGPVVFVNGTSAVTAFDVLLRDAAAADAPPRFALQVLDAASFACARCAFARWGAAAPQAVASAGALRLREPDFTQSSCAPLIATGPGAPLALVVNAVVNAGNYDSGGGGSSSSGGAQVAPPLAQGVTACANSADLCGPAEHCIDGDVGVYCAAAAPALPPLALAARAPGAQFHPVPRSVNVTLALACGSSSSSAQSANAAIGNAPIMWSIAADTEDARQPWTAAPPSGILRCSGGGGSAQRGLAGADAAAAAPREERIDIVVTGPPDSGSFALNLTAWTWLRSDGSGGDGDGSGVIVAAAAASLDSVHWYCRSGLYWTGSECRACADISGGAKGLECSADGAADVRLPVRGGYWMPAAALGEGPRVLECQNEAVCLGGLDNACHPGNGGPYCSLCAPDHATGIGGKCYACSEGVRVAAQVVFAVIAIAVCAVVAYGASRLARAETAEEAARAALDATGRVSELLQCLGAMNWSKLKIPLVALQIVVQFPTITGIPYPPVLRRLFSVLSILNFNIGWGLSAGCLFRFNFYQRLLMYTLTPLCVVGLLSMTYVVHRWRVLRRAAAANGAVVAVRAAAASGGGSSGGAAVRVMFGPCVEDDLALARSKHVQLIVVMCFLIFPAVTTVIFETFVCDNLGSALADAPYYLAADYSIMCNTAQHRASKIYAGFMVAVYVAGIPALFAAVLVAHDRAKARDLAASTLTLGARAETPLTLRARAKTPPPPSPRQQRRRWQRAEQARPGMAIRFLTQNYTQRQRYFEVVECFRRLALTGMLVFIPSQVQVETACSLAVLSLVLFALVRPFRESTDYASSMLAGLVVFFCFFIGLLNEVQTTTGDVFAALVVAVSAILTVATLIQCVVAAHAVSGSMLTMARKGSKPPVPAPISDVPSRSRSTSSLASSAASSADSSSPDAAALRTASDTACGNEGPPVRGALTNVNFATSLRLLMHEEGSYAGDDGSSSADGGSAGGGGGGSSGTTLTGSLRGSTVLPDTPSPT